MSPTKMGGGRHKHQSAWKSWLGWCSGQLPDPFSPSVGDIVEFLSDECHKGKSYSSINTLRSSLSSILNTIDGFAVGKHPTVIRNTQQLLDF